MTGFVLNLLPGTYIALDCEMVGVGPLGSESSLARVSVVNYNGAVLLDSFVRQKERVTDWRTRWSGVRESDMVNAKSFEEVQLIVSDLLKNRTLVGHAVHNDMQALMLSHPRAQTRDTQHLAHKHGQSRAPRPALRNLVSDMFGLAIQDGEHSSVIDARATMAVFRLHRKQWERPYATVPVRVRLRGTSQDPSAASAVDSTPSTSTHKGKRKRNSVEDEDNANANANSDDDDDDDTPATPRPPPKPKTKPLTKVHASGAVQKKGVSTGLSTVVSRRGKGDPKGGNKTDGGGGGGTATGWWKQLGGGGSKGGVKMSFNR
ncbi:ribonuclease H-like domain-containing protein [Amylostereum chailletii]|nr:ribonuclease H-like domain-containing protein [Amylostereum chailletii]